MKVTISLTWYQRIKILFDGEISITLLDMPDGLTADYVGCAEE